MRGWRTLLSGGLLASFIVLPVVAAVLGPPDVASAGSYGFLRKWGSLGASDGQFKMPGDIAIDSAGDVYVADTGNHRIQKFSSTGTWLQTWGGSGAGPGKLSGPLGVAVDGQGNLYVADTGNSRVQKFSSDGQFLVAWGTKGAGTGQMSGPKGIALDAAGLVYVADTGNGRIQKFTAEGDFLGLWLVPGLSDGSRATVPALALDSAGNVYLTDSNSSASRVLKFTNAGELLTKWGAPGALPEQFSTPTGIAVDNSGNVYVSDTLNNRVQKFSSDGTFHLAFGSFGSTDGRMYAATGVAVDGAGNVYLADTKNNRVQVFGTAPDPGPSLTAPMNGAMVPNLGVTLSWLTQPGTAQYHLQVIPHNNDGPGANVIRNADSSYFTLPSPPQWYGLLPDMTYTWRIRTTSAAFPQELDWSAWSSRTFKTPGVSSDTIRLMEPAAGNTIDSRTPTLTWSNSNGAVFYYEVQVSKDPAFETNPETATAMVYWQLLHGAVTSPPNSYAVPSSFPLESNSTYYWRVRPRIQGDGMPVSWTGAGMFRTR